MTTETQTPEMDTDAPVVDPNIEVNAGDEVEENANDVPESGNWFDNLEPDFKSDPDITKYKSLQEYAKGNREVRKMVGRDKLVVPTSKSTQEEVDTFYNKLGRPAELSGYNLPKLDNVPEAIQTSDTDIETFRETAHKLGITNEQFEGLFAMQTELKLNGYNQELTKVEGMAKETETELRKEYGAAYDSKIDSAQKVINTFFKGKDMHPAFATLSSDKGFVKAMSEIADNMGEDVIGGQQRHTRTPEESTKEMASILGGTHDLSKAYFDELSPEHQTAVDHMISLQTMAG